jgi:hypothetical protein
MTSHGFKDATTDLERISDWWTKHPQANIGIATGPISNIWVLDIDARHHGEGALTSLVQQHGPLPPTIESISGGGGRHLYFRWPRDRSIRNSAGRLGEGLDVRGSGGYIIAPPSMHASGKRYAWHVESGVFSDAPGWLLDLAAVPSKASVAAAACNPPQDLIALIENGVVVGRRNDAITRLAGMLLSRNVDASVVLVLAQSWNITHCRPPLPWEEVVLTVNSIAGAELRRRGLVHGR